MKCPSRALQEHGNNWSFVKFHRSLKLWDLPSNTKLFRFSIGVESDQICTMIALISTLACVGLYFFGLVTEALSLKPFSNFEIEINVEICRVELYIWRRKGALRGKYFQILRFKSERWDVPKTKKLTVYNHIFHSVVIRVSAIQKLLLQCKVSRCLFKSAILVCNGKG